MPGLDVSCRWAALVAPGAAVLASTDCRAPTQITVTVTTDIDCTHVSATSLAAGSVTGLDTRPASAETTACSGGRVGALVVVPSGSSNAEVGLRVVMGLDGKSPDDCVRDGYVGGCIVARRALRFLPYEPLSVPVEMRSSRACDTTGAQPNAPWPMYGYCAVHRGRSPFVGPQTTPHIVWSDYQNADSTRGALLDASGNVYVTTTDGKIVVVDSNDQPKWTYTSTDTGTPPIAGMSALGADGTLYVPQRASIAAVAPGGRPGGRSRTRCPTASWGRSRWRRRGTSSSTIL